jgi:hypothetical protein
LDIGSPGLQQINSTLMASQKSDIGVTVSADASLRVTPRHCGVRSARLISRDSQALISNFLQLHQLSIFAPERGGLNPES